MVSVIRRFCLCLITLSIFVSAGAWADSQPPRLGLAMRPQLLDGQAQLLSEDVEIGLGFEKIFVRAKYVFDNPTERSRAVEVGFPMESEQELGLTSIRVQGKLQRFRHIPGYIHQNGTAKGVDWRFWLMDLAAGQKVAVQTKTVVEPFSETADVFTPYRQHRDKIWREFSTDDREIPPAVLRVMDAIDSQVAGYSMRENTWEQPVERTVVRAMGSDVTPGSIRSFSSKNDAVITSQGVTWVLRNVGHDKPASVWVEYNPWLSLDQELQLVSQTLEAFPKSQSLSAFRDYLLYLKMQIDK